MFRAGADFDHCEDILEMVVNPMAGLFAPLTRLVHHLQEVALILVLQQQRQRMRRPVFITTFIFLPDALEGGVMLHDNILFGHGRIFPCAAKG